MNSPTSSGHGAFPATDLMHPPTRREFLSRVGAGLMIWVVLRRDLSGAESESAVKSTYRPELPKDFNAFLSIGEDGRITCFTGKIEMGQGPITSLPQMLADELDAPLDQVDIVMGDTELCPYDQGTWGSLTTRAFGPHWRAAAAEARAVLIELGAVALSVPAARLITRDGMVIDSQNPSRAISYGAITKGKRIERHLSVTPDLKKPSEFKIVGKPLLRRDSRDKVTGKAHFTGDLRLPGMLYAKVLRPPAHGAKLLHVDCSAACSMAGVTVVQQPDLVAVLHAMPDVAEAALDKVKAEFSPSASTLDDRTIYKHLADYRLPARVFSESGDLASGRKAAVKRLDAVYLNAYVAHAAMEPHTALAEVGEKKATVWASTQNPFGAREEIAKALDLPILDVRVITPFVGGGFGGKSANGQAVEAALLSKATGKPVQVMWSREEEFFNDTFRPAAVVNVSAGIDASGRMVLWDYEDRFGGSRGSELIYTVADHRISAVGDFWGPREAHPFAVGAWRAPGCNTNAFARESHVSRLAELAGADPVEFRLRHLSDPRARRVLEAASNAWDWKPAVGSSGRGLGVAIGMDSGTYVATIAEVAVDRSTGHVQVKRVLCAQEMGLVINPEGAKMQMEGCITMGLGYALTEEIHFNAGVIHDTNFDSYDLPRFSWVPKMETILLDAENDPPQGGGEPAIIVMGAVLANAIYDACGARLLELPMTPVRIKNALAKTTPA